MIHIATGARQDHLPGEMASFFVLVDAIPTLFEIDREPLQAKTV